MGTLCPSKESQKCTAPGKWVLGYLPGDEELLGGGQSHIPVQSRQERHPSSPPGRVQFLLQRINVAKPSTGGSMALCTAPRAQPLVPELPGLGHAGGIDGVVILRHLMDLGLEFAMTAN